MLPSGRNRAVHNISALPVIDGEKRVIGMLTAMNLGKLFGRWLK